MSFKGFEPTPGSNTGSTNLPSSRPTQSSFPPSDFNGRPGSSVFVPSSTSGTYSTDAGSSTGDFSTTPVDGSSFPDSTSNTRPSSQSPDDLYTINNKYPATYPTNNRNPQNTGNQSPDEPTPTRPIETNHPPSDAPKPIEPSHVHSYPVGPDPFPGYFPHVHPHYHFNLDHDYTDDKDSHFPGIYAHNSPSLHDRYYHGAPQPHPHIDHYGSGGLYAAGRYPEADLHMQQGGGGGGGYGGNRKNGYQVTDNSPDVPMGKGEC